MTFSKRQNNSNAEPIGWLPGLGMGEGRWVGIIIEGDHEGEGAILYHDCAGGYKNLYIG